MPTPAELERAHTLRTATVRHDELRARELVAGALTRDEALELLALGEVVARKASYGRQLTVRSARGAGASWSQIGEALGTTKQSAWEAHDRWIDAQVDLHRSDDVEGWDEGDARVARSLAGDPDEPDPAART